MRLVFVEQAIESGASLQHLQQCLAVIATLREQVATLEGRNESLENKLSMLQSTLNNYVAENDLLKRRLFGTKSERTNTSEFQLVLNGLFPEAQELQKQYEQMLCSGNDPEREGSEPKPEPEKKPRPKPKGRRDLSVLDLPRINVDIDDPELAKQGRLIDREQSFELLRFPGCLKVLVKHTAVYELARQGQKTLVTASQPRRLFARSLCNESVYAWIANEKFGLGVPLYRLEQKLELQQASIDRGTMCRYMEELGGTLGATVVHAMFEDARTHCHVLSTDATGASIQPVRTADKRRQACDKGHFFTVVADCDHVLYHYTRSHTSKAVSELFAGFSGYLQSDAASVYDILERGPPGEGEKPLQLVGCWAHCRRYFFEAAVTKHPAAVEGLRQIRDIFAAEAKFAKLDAVARLSQRQHVIAPLFDRFFAWVEHARQAEPGRTKLTQALGYASNQQKELRRVLLDGRLALDNNRSERALRRIVVGRKNWLFYGSDVHAEGAAAIFTVLASCRLHRIEPETYLREVLRVLAYWPSDRYIELAPNRWQATRSRLDPAQLAAHLGEIAVPPKVELASAAG